MGAGSTGWYILLCLLPTAYCLLVAAACQPAPPEVRDPERGRVLRIGLHGEVGYAPLVIMQKRLLLEQRVPGLVVEWKAIPSFDGVYEALTGGGLDIATGTATSFLLARERGAPVRALAGVSEVPMAVVTARARIDSIRDLRWGDQIVVPARGSHEHVMVRMAALRELGDWSTLDPLITVRTDSADPIELLARREAVAQVLVSPLLDRALSVRGARRLVDLADVTGGPLTTIVAYSTTAARERQSALFQMFLEELRRASRVAAAESAETARLLLEIDGREATGGSIAAALARPDLRFAPEVRGLERLARFMRHTGQLTATPTTWADLTFEDTPR